MAYQEEISRHDETGKQPLPQKRTSKRVSDHLANERTFLAWIRTGVAIMGFGFVVARFGLALRELAARNPSFTILSLPFSSFVGVLLVVLGTAITIAALVTFIQVRNAIDREEFHPQLSFSVLLTVLSSLVGIIVAIYLILTP